VIRYELPQRGCQEHMARTGISLEPVTTTRRWLMVWFCPGNPTQQGVVFFSLGANHCYIVAR